METSFPQVRSPVLAAATSNDGRNVLAAYGGFLFRHEHIRGWGGAGSQGALGGAAGAAEGGETAAEGQDDDDDPDFQ